MRSYVGPLLDSLDGEIPDSVEECDGSWMHSGARHHTITQICVGQRVKLTRRKLLPSNGEIPGVVEGYCYGSSHQAGGRVYIALDCDNGDAFMVDVSDPGAWSWQVGCG